MSINVLCRGDRLTVSGDIALTYLLPPAPGERQYMLQISDGARVVGKLDGDGWHWLALTRHTEGKTMFRGIGPDTGFTHDAHVTSVDLTLGYEPVYDQLEPPRQHLLAELVGGGLG